MNELFYNNLQEAYNLFLDALDRAKNIKDYVLIKNIFVFSLVILNRRLKFDF